MTYPSQYKALAESEFFKSLEKAIVERRAYVRAIRIRRSKIPRSIFAPPTGTALRFYGAPVDFIDDVKYGL